MPDIPLTWAAAILAHPRETSHYLKMHNVLLRITTRQPLTAYPIEGTPLTQQKHRCVNTELPSGLRNGSAPMKTQNTILYSVFGGLL